MASRRLDISLHLDRSQQAKAEAEARADSAKTAKQVISDADMAEKEKVKRAKESAAARAKAEKELAAAIVKAKREAAAEFDKIMRQSEAEAKKVDAERLASERKVAQETARAQQKAAQDSLRAHQTKAKQAQTLIAEETKQQDKLFSSQMNSVGSLVKMSAAMVGIQGVSSVFSAIVADLDKTKAYAEKTAEEILKMRGAIRELAALRGELGVTGPTTAHVAAMAAQTLQTSGEATQTEQAFRGIAELAVGKSITAGQADELSVSAGKFQSLEGGSPDAHGALMGQVALQSKGKLSTPEAEARAMRLFKIQQPGAFRTGTQAMDQFAKLNGQVMNGILSPEQAMGLASAFSLKDPGTAATSVEQFIQATLPAQFKARGLKLDPDMDSEKTFEYLKGLGIKDEKDPMVVADKIAADLKTQAAKDPNFSAIKYLPEHGYGNQQQVQALMDYAGLENSGNFAKIREAMGADLEYGPTRNGVQTGVISERHAARTRNDPLYRDMKVARYNDLVNLNKGTEETALLTARKAAFSSLKDENQLRGEYEEWGNPSAVAQLGMDVGTRGGYSKIEMRTRELLKAEAKRLNIPENSVKKSWFDFSGIEQSEDIDSLAKRVNAAGGSASNQIDVRLEKSSASLERGMAKFEKVADKLEKAMNPPVPAPVQGRPNPPVTRVP